ELDTSEEPLIVLDMTRAQRADALRCRSRQQPITDRGWRGLAETRRRSQQHRDSIGVRDHDSRAVCMYAAPLRQDLNGGVERDARLRFVRMPGALGQRLTVHGHECVAARRDGRVSLTTK